MHTGAIVQELEQLVTIAEAAHWHRSWFGSDGVYPEGTFPIEPWLLIARVRLRLADGAKGDGIMSPGAVDAWYDLEKLQNKLMKQESFDDAHLGATEK